MKPFIINALKNGKYFLEFQCEGETCGELNELFQGSNIISYSIPDGHSFQSAWLFHLFFSNGYMIEFSSACTEIGGWKEIGSLNLLIGQETELFRSQKVKLFRRITVNGFFVRSIDCLIYEDVDVYAECGIVFCDSHGGEIFVVAGQAPGSVSVLAPFTVGHFQPEFPLLDYRRVHL